MPKRSLIERDKNIHCEEKVHPHALYSKKREKLGSMG
jgi:hypothetical protein